MGGFRLPAVAMTSTLLMTPTSSRRSNAPRDDASHPRPRFVSRLPAWVAPALAACGLVLALFGLVQLGVDIGDRAMLARIARQELGSADVPEEQRLVRAIRYSSERLHDTTLETLRPWTVRAYYQFNPLHPGPGDVLRWGRDYRGGCGSSCRVAKALLTSSGIPARQLLLLDEKGRSAHTVIQAQIDGRWVVADALFGIVFRRRDGALATVEDLRADPAQYWSAVAAMPHYMGGRFGFESVSLINWRKIPVVMPALRSLLAATIGEQAVQNIRRPWFWMWPHTFYGMVSLMLSALALFGAWRIRRSSRASR